MPITPLPELDRTSATFRADCNEFFGTLLPAFSVEAEAARVEVDGAVDATAADAISTAADAAATAADAIATAANRVQTGLDRVQTGLDAASAAASAATASSAVAFVDSNPVVKGSADATKQVRFEVDGLTTATTRVLTVPDTDMTLAGKDVQQAFTKPQRPSLSSETAPSSNTVTWDLTTDSVFRINLDANITTFNLTGTLANLAGYQFQAIVRFNGGTTIAWNANMEYTADTAPTLTGTSGKVDIFNFVVATANGTDYKLLCTGYSQNLG